MIQCAAKDCSRTTRLQRGCLNMHAESGEKQTWVDVAGLFPAPRECLAAFFASAAAEVLSGVKPANLVRISDRRLSCGRRMFQLWRKYGEEFLSNSPLAVKIMYRGDNGVLALVYRPELLERRLRSRTMQAFLERLGYPCLPTLDQALEHLQRSFKEGLPHEIGMFLGYPAKDVKGFMEQESLPWQGKGLWRIYGPPARSLELDELYRSKRQQVFALLLNGFSPFQLLQGI